MKTELILEIIQERWSPYSFSPVPVEEFKLKAMFEAAGYAPSCNNEQPWLFAYTTQEEKDIFADYLGFLNESNQVWAKDAWVLAVSMARNTFRRNDKVNRFAFHDTGMAVANLLLQALAMDIYVHQMGGFSVEKVREYFMLPDNIDPIAVMAIGYLGEGNDLPLELIKRDEIRRSRRSVNEYAFRNSLSNPAF
jgi:nitroreductase